MIKIPNLYPFQQIRARQRVGKCALAAAVIFAAGLPNLAHAQPAASPWVKGSLSQVRLIAGTFDGKIYHAGVEIQLKGKAHTYWRNPGDGGVPPQFNYSKSQNLAKAQTLFPAPTRSGAPGEEIIGYERAVVFPVQISPASAKDPVELDLTLHYAACEKICVPEQANLRLTLGPARQNPAMQALIARYAALLPRPFSEKGAPTLEIAAKDPGKSWTFRIAGASAGPLDLFVEGPDGWYFDRKAGTTGVFELKLAQKPENSAKTPPVHVTVTTAAGAFEGKRALP